MSSAEVRRRVLSELLSASEDRRSVSLDDIGDAIGTEPFSVDDIDDLVQALEGAGREITWDRGGGAADLRKVIPAARMLAVEHGRAAHVEEIAARAGLSPRAVRTALAFARVLAKGSRA